MQNRDVSKTKQVQINALDRPKVNIINVEHPNEIEYGQDFEIKFGVEGNQDSIAKEAHIIFYYPGSKKEWEFANLLEKQLFVL